MEPNQADAERAVPERARPLEDPEPLTGLKIRGADKIDIRYPGWFSAVSKPIFASKHSFQSSRRDLHKALLCTVSKFCLNVF